MSTRDYEDLSSAIVKLACDDYRAVLRSETPSSQSWKQTLEAFFCSPRFELFTSLDGPSLMHRLQRESAG